MHSDTDYIAIRIAKKKRDKPIVLSLFIARTGQT
jgi:hypothetical protein